MLVVLTGMLSMPSTTSAAVEQFLVPLDIKPSGINLEPLCSPCLEHEGSQE